MNKRDRPEVGSPSAKQEARGPEAQSPGRSEPTEAKKPAFGTAKTTKGEAPEAPVSLPAISAPKGGGAVRGISERFQANAATGTGSMQVSLGLSPGRSGFAPQLALSYDSGSGNGPCGLGWTLGGGSVQRKTSKGVPRYVGSLDTFVFSGGEDLISVGASLAVQEGAEAYQVQRYRPRVERSFERVERWTHLEDGDVHWRTYGPTDVCSIFGRTAGARVVDPQDHQRVYQWLLEEQWDGRGSVIWYVYKPEDLAGVDGAVTHEAHRVAVGQAGGLLYLKRVLYGNAAALNDRSVPLGSVAVDPSWRFEVVLDYGEHATDARVETQTWPVRPDPFSTYRAGFELRTYRLLQRVLMFHRFPELGPAAEAEGVLVRSTVLTHGQYVDDGQGGVSVVDDPVASKLLRVEQRGHCDGGMLALPPADFEYSSATWNEQLHVVHRDTLPAGVDGDRVQWVDLDGEGLPGALVSSKEAWWYRRPEGSGRFGAPRLVERKPAFASPNDGIHQLVDLQGDGRLDLVRYAPPNSGYYAQTGTYGGAGARVGFDGYRTIRSVPNIDFKDPNLRFLDVTGDGRADIVLTQGDLLICYRGQGAAGFDEAVRVPVARDERAGPRVVFSDPESTIFLGDMTGDGLSDIVRVERSRICYWPNRGHGHFGARVNMSTPPLLDDVAAFDPRRVRLADLDGSGPADLIYLHSDGVRVYINQAGNGWSEGRVLRALPLPHRLADVQVVDLLGRGTACLVWSSSAPGAASRVAYVDLFGREDDAMPPPSAYKPHLLVRATNNMGSETRIRYTPSTKFYLEARGTPDAWATRLHFPVQVVDRLEHEDFVSKVQLVQRFAYHHGYYDPDEREFNGFGYVEQWDEESYDAARGSGRYDDALTGGRVGWVPPVYTRSWFHTGASRARNALEAALLTRAHPNPDGLARLPGSVLPAGLSTQEEKDACRALRGQALRQEVYGLDEGPQESLPYLVTETQVEVHRLVSGAPDARQSVFTVLPRQTRTFHTEREGADARVIREVTLEVSPTDAQYGHVRRSATIAFGRSVGPQAQTRHWAQHTDAEVVHHDTVGGVYRIRQVIRARAWEAQGAAATKEADVDPLRAAIDGAVQVALSDVETLYWNAAQNAERPRGEGDPAGFVRRVRALAVPAALQAAVYDAAGATPGYDSAQWSEGGHELVGGDAWAPTPVVHYRPVAEFHLPYQVVDPFGNASQVTYDGHGLFPVEAQNALGHVVASTLDYHALAPAEVVDPNLNHVEVAYDALGAVLRVARKGKDLGGGQWEGRTLAAPHEIYAYVRDAWLTGGRPNSVRAELFSSHDPADGASLVSYTYMDGAGQEVLTKAQAEPGPAPLQDPVTGALVRDAQGNLQLTPPGTARWVGSGRQVLNNKGAPLKQYEPYFSSVPAFDGEAELIYQSPAVVMHYDVLGRPVRTQHPDGTEERVERFTWSEVAHDASDTVTGSRWAVDAAASVDPEVQRALALSLAHAGTPTVQHLDGLGRGFQVDEDNGTAGVPVLHSTVTALDIQGRALSITDARGNTAGTQQYDLLGRVLALTTADGGSRWMLPAVDGQAVRTWDQRGHARRVTYDALRRPVSEYVSSGGGAETVRLHQVYGQALGVPAAQAVNLLGALHEVYDGAGVRTVASQDFDGHPVASSRRLRVTPAGADPQAAWSAYAQGPDWSALPGAADLAALRAAAAPSLEAEMFSQAGSFDALGRPATVTTPDASVTRYGYNEAGLLDVVDIDLRGAGAWTPFVTGIDYDAQGRRGRIGYGNGVETTYAYDADSRRLTQLKSQRGGGGTVLQDLGYTYDAAGNIVALSDGAQQTTYFNNAVVTPDRRYEYDARHRLVRAEGRCHPGQQPTSTLPPNRDVPHANDATTLEAYAEAYVYDGAGNILSMAQTRGGVVAWRRRYQYALASNRLESTSASMAEPDQDTYFDPAVSARYVDVYAHDAHGNMTSMPGLALDGWNSEDWLVEVGLGGGGDVYYSYDGGGERVRKVIRRQNGAEVVERLYLDGWEVYRRHLGGVVDEAIETLHVMDDLRRMALVETKTVSGGAVLGGPVPRARYQLEDHLGTCTVEVDGTAQANVLTYEEYFPYGATAYRAAAAGVDLSPKRYRYTTKERDEETGLDYFGARYYASWLGRWTAADPAGFVDRGNLYASMSADPVGRRDVDGRQPSLLDPIRQANLEAKKLGKYSVFEITVARSKLISRSKTFRELHSLDTEVVSESHREVYEATRTDIEDTIRAKMSARSRELGRPLDLAEQGKITSKAMEAGVMSGVATYRGGGYLFRTFAEFLRGRKSGGKTDTRKDEIRLEGRGPDLEYELAHEFGHRFRPSKDEPHDWTADPSTQNIGILTDLAGSDEELFAELFGQFILAEARGDQDFSPAVLRYDESELTIKDEVRREMNEIFRSNVSAKEKASRIDLLVREKLVGSAK